MHAHHIEGETAPRARKVIGKVGPGNDTGT
jgi:hypothetical protein